MFWDAGILFASRQERRWSQIRCVHDWRGSPPASLAVAWSTYCLVSAGSTLWRLPVKERGFVRNISLWYSTWGHLTLLSLCTLPFKSSTKPVCSTPLYPKPSQKSRLGHTHVFGAKPCKRASKAAPRRASRHGHTGKLTVDGIDLVLCRFACTWGAMISKSWGVSGMFGVLRAQMATSVVWVVWIGLVFVVDLRKRL